MEAYPETGTEPPAKIQQKSIGPQTASFGTILLRSHNHCLIESCVVIAMLNTFRGQRMTLEVLTRLIGKRVR